MKLPLDHIGYLGSDIDALVDSFRALGFHVVGPAVLQTDGADDPASGPVQVSAHVMFPDTYIELTAVTGCTPDHHLAPYLDIGAGIRLLLLACADADAVHAELEQAGQPAAAVASASRELSYGARGTARFRWFALPDGAVPGTLTGFVEHRTRDAVFDPEVCTHPNTVRAIAALYHRAGEMPGALAAAAGGAVEFIADEAAAESGAFLTGVELVAGDLDACRACLAANGVPFEAHRHGVRVAAPHAGGAFMIIRADRAAP